MRKTKVGQDIITGFKAAIAHERGKRKLRTSTIKIPDEPGKWSKQDVIQLRTEKLDNISQPKFALILGVSSGTVRAWEQGAKNPSGSARRLLDIIDISPGIVNKLPSSDGNKTISINSMGNQHCVATTRRSLAQKKVGTSKAARKSARCTVKKRRRKVD